MNTSTNDIDIINLPKVFDRRGNLSVIEQFNHVPFKIERAFWIYDVPGDSVRGGHAFRETEEFIVALSGSFDVVLHDGEREQTYHLSRSYYGVHVPKMVWREMRNFSTNSIALVVASSAYNESDYIMVFEEFVKEKKSLPNQVVSRTPIQKPLVNWHIRKPTVYDCSVMELPKYSFDEGNLFHVMRMCRSILNVFSIFMTFRVVRLVELMLIKSAISFLSRQVAHLRWCWMMA